MTFDGNYDDDVRLGAYALYCCRSVRGEGTGPTNWDSQRRREADGGRTSGDGECDEVLLEVCRNDCFIGASSCSRTEARS
jgi:hypothetical protein